jgi:hypothetical protein
MADVAARLEGVNEELTDIAALDALRRGSQGDPHSARPARPSRSSAASSGPGGRSRRRVAILAPAGESLVDDGP